MADIEILEIAGEADRSIAFAIRRRVFCDEQGVNPALEFDGLDPVCRLYLARWRDRPVGTARLRQIGAGAVKIERVAVEAPARGRGIGTALMDRTIGDARAAGAERIEIHAQCHVEAFYAARGFRATGAPFDEAGIPHVRMVL